MQQKIFPNFQALSNLIRNTLQNWEYSYGKELQNTLRVIIYVMPRVIIYYDTTNKLVRSQSSC